MRAALIQAELLTGLKKPAFWLGAVVLAGMTFALVHAITIGLPFARIQLIGEEFVVNSMRNMYILATFVSWLMVFLIANIFAFQANRDFAYNAQALVFSSGVSKLTFVWARFTAAFTQCLLLSLASFVGFIAARFMPYIDPSYFQADSLGLYAWPFLIKTLPNIFILGAVFFSLNLLLRNQLINWVSVMALYLLSIAMLRMNETDWLAFAYLAEPLGIKLALASRGIEGEQFVYDTYLLGNRLIWISVAALIMVCSVLSFKLKDEADSLFGGKVFARVLHSFRRSKSKIDDLGSDYMQSSLDRALLQSINVLTWKQNAKIWLGSFRFELAQIVLNRYFLLLSFLGFFYLFWVSRLIGRSFETNTFPVTYAVLDIFQGAFGLFFFAIIVLFSAEALWRDRENKVDGITGSFPISENHYLSAKASALLATLFILNTVMMLGGILVQRVKGYFDHELDLYVTQLFGLGFIDFSLLLALSFFVFSLVRNKYQGYAVMGAYYLFDSFAATALLQHNLLIFGAAPTLTYSDLNGFGPNLVPYLIFKAFWCLLALWFVKASVWVWQRSETERAPLINVLKTNIVANPRRSLALTVSIALGASFILYHTLVLNSFVIATAIEKKQALYEETYRHFADEPQVDIDKLSMALEIEPDAARVYGQMSARLTNNSNTAIHHLHVEFDPEKIHSVIFERETQTVLNDEDLGVFRWELMTPLMPGESMIMSMALDDHQTGFANSGRRTDVVNNGTFYEPPIPRIAYQTGRELTGGRRRSALGLPDKPNYIARDTDGVEERSFLGLEESFIELDIIIGAPLDQQAFAPGDLQRSWQENGRAYFHYASDEKVLNFVSILSGRYQHSQATWIPENNNHQAVELSVYHHPKHSANIDAMLEASKLSMDEFTRRFGPYPHNQLRILEFPRYATYAQSFAANIPFSESIGFIADVRNIDDESTSSFAQATIDYPFFVTAHEIAHQWWAHQLIAADAEGANFIVESLSQYSALKVYERKYGATGVKKLLQYYSNRYGIARNNERELNRERPLLRVRDGQTYVHYSKGISALYAVSEQMGEGQFDAALRAFLDQYSYKNREYPTTLQFIDILLSYAPNDTHDYVKEQLEQITLISYTPKNAVYQRQEDFTYTVQASIDFNKQFQMDDGSLIDGNTETLVDIGFYNSKGEEILVSQTSLKNGHNAFQFELPRKPANMIIEPYYKWQESNLIKNTIALLPAGNE